jgi:hypothetical protein
MSPDLRALLEEANRLRREYPTTPLAKIDAWIRENAPDVPSYAELRNRILVQDAQGKRTAPARRGASDFVTAAQANIGAGMNPAGAASAQDPTFAPNMARSAARGATLNFDDNLARAVGFRTAPGQMYSPEGEARFREFQEQNPVLDAALNMAGGAPSMGLLGGAVKKVVARQAAKSAPEALTAARIALAEGTVPAILRGGAIGGATGGVSAMGDDRSGAEVVGATALGGLFGAAIPGAIGGVQAAYRVGVSPRFSAAQVAREGVEQIGNLSPGPGGVPVAGDPITMRQRVGDLLNPARVQLRTEAGLNRMAVDEAALAASGRGGAMTPIDADPTANGLLLGQSVNAVRQNPAAAGLSGVEAMGQRATQTGALVRGDIADAYAAGGVTPPITRSPTLGMDGRNVRMATAIENATGGVPTIKGPTLAGKPQASRARWSVDARATEIEETTRAFGRSAEGYGGLQPTVQAGSGGSGTSPEVLDQAALLVERNAQNMTDGAARSFFAKTVANLRRLRGGPKENIPVWMESVQSELRDMNAFIAKARAPKPPGDPNALYVDADKLEALEFARESLLKYADDGFVGPRGQRFSQISRRYAQGMDDARAVKLGAALFDGSVPGEGAITRTRAEQLLAELSGSERQNAYQGILSRQIETLRSGNSADDATATLNTLLNRAGGEYRQNELVKAAFPTKAAYQKALNQFVLMDAADQGVAAFRTTSPAQVEAAFRRLDLAGRDEFKARLVGAMEDQLRNPKDARAFVRRAGKDVQNDAGEWMTKFGIVFGKDGANEMRQRLLLQARMERNTRAIIDAATNTSATPEFANKIAQGQGNAVNPLAFLTGIARPAVRASSRRASKTELAKLLTGRGDAGMTAFRDAVRGAAAPVSIPRGASTNAAAAAGYFLPNTIFGRPIPE